MASSSSSYYHRSAAVHQPPYLASTAASPVINHPSFGAAPHNGNNNNNNNGDGDQNDTGPDGSSNNNPNTPLPGRDVILPSSSSSSFPYHSEYLALIQTFHTAYQHAASPETKRMLAQQVWDVMVTDHRARFFCRPPPDDNHHNDSSSVGPARPLTREQALPHIGKALEEWRRDQSGPEEPNGTGPSFSSSSSPRKTKRSRPNPNNNGSSNIFNNHSSSSSHPPPAAAATAAAAHSHPVAATTTTTAAATPRLGLDVICGRGEEVKRFNEHYRVLIRNYTTAYLNCSNNIALKRLLANEVCNEILQRGGRFFQSPRGLELLSRRDALVKIMKALKDSKRSRKSLTNGSKSNSSSSPAQQQRQQQASLKTKRAQPNNNNNKGWSHSETSWVRQQQQQQQQQPHQPMTTTATPAMHQSLAADAIFGLMGLASSEAPKRSNSTTTDVGQQSPPPAESYPKDGDDNDDMAPPPPTPFSPPDIRGESEIMMKISREDWDDETALFRLNPAEDQGPPKINRSDCRTVALPICGTFFPPPPAGKKRRKKKKSKRQRSESSCGSLSSSVEEQQQQRQQRDVVERRKKLAEKNLTANFSSAELDTLHMLSCNMTATLLLQEAK